MIKSAIARTPILVFILMFMAVGYTIAHNKVVVVPLGAQAAAAGITGYQTILVSELIGIAPGANFTLSAVCPTGKKVIGGGASNSIAALTINQSYPRFETTWQARIYNGGSINLVDIMSVFAICANTID